MTVHSITPILNVSDMAGSLAWFSKIGWKTCWTWGEPATFSAVGNGAVQIFLCHNGQGSRGGSAPRHVGDDDTGGVWMSWFVASPAEVDAVHEMALRESLKIGCPPTDQPWGVREFHLVHPDGHTFRVSAIFESHG